MAGSTRERALTVEAELHVAVAALKAAERCVVAKSEELDALHAQWCAEVREQRAADAVGAT